MCLFIIYLQALTVSITFPVTVIKCPRPKQLRENKVYFDLQSQDMQSIMRGISCQQESQAAGHTASTVRTHRAVNVCPQLVYSFLSSQDPHPRKRAAHFRTGLHIQ